MNDTEYLSKLESLQQAYATSSFSDFAKQFPMIANEIKPKVVSERNQLTQKQTTALIKLWEKWRTEGNLKLNRIAHSPYGVPYISIERRNYLINKQFAIANYLINKQFEWDWCITYDEEYDGQGTQIVWYSNSKDPMPKQIKDFLRMAYNREFVKKVR